MEPIFDYGRFDGNGTRTGIIGMLHTEKADFTMSWSLQYDVHQTICFTQKLAKIETFSYC